MLNYVAIEPANTTNTTNTTNSTVIWLHGLGASGHDFEPIVPQLGLPVGHGVRFIFPHAPMIPVTINAGITMPAWFDIISLSSEREINTEQLATSVRQLHQLIDREIERGINSQRIIIIGFSQGGTVAYHGALTYPQTLGGILALSTYFVRADQISPHPANRKLPIRIYHGSYDTVIPEIAGRNACEQLQAMGYRPHYTTYPIGHSVCNDEIADVSHDLSALFGYSQKN